MGVPCFLECTAHASVLYIILIPFTNLTNCSINIFVLYDPGLALILSNSLHFINENSIIFLVITNLPSTILSGLAQSVE